MSEPPERPARMRRVIVVASSALLVVAAVCLLVSGFHPAEVTSELLEQKQQPAEDVESLQKRVAKLTWLLDKASRQAQSAEEQEQVARSALDQEKTDFEKVTSKKPKSDLIEPRIEKSEQKLRQELDEASAHAKAAEARRKSLQTKLDAQIEKLADVQLQGDNSDSGLPGEYIESTHVVDHAATPKAVVEKEGPKAKSPTVQGKEAADASSQVAALRNKLADLTSTLKMLRASEAQVAALANVGGGLLQMPKVQAAIKQSLSEADLKIAMEIAKSLNMTTPLGDVDPKIVAEVAIATDERDKQGLPKPDANLTAVEEAIMKEIEQAQNEIKIEDKLKKSS